MYPQTSWRCVHHTCPSLIVALHGRWSSIQTELDPPVFLSPINPTLHTGSSLKRPYLDKILIQEDRDINIKNRNSMRTNIVRRINLGPKDEMGENPGKRKSFTKLVKSMGLRIRKSDSYPISAAYMLYALAHNSCSINSGWMNKPS